MVDVRNPNPRPTAARREGPRMSLAKPPPTETRLNQTSPSAMSAMPATRIGLNPNRVTS
jgi:hypothetical protein